MSQWEIYSQGKYPAEKWRCLQTRQRTTRTFWESLRHEKTHVLLRATGWDADAGTIKKNKKKKLFEILCEIKKFSFQNLGPAWGFFLPRKFYLPTVTLSRSGGITWFLFDCAKICSSASEKLLDTLTQSWFVRDAKRKKPTKQQPRSLSVPGCILYWRQPKDELERDVKIDQCLQAKSLSFMFSRNTAAAALTFSNMASFCSLWFDFCEIVLANAAVNIRFLPESRKSAGC